MSRSLGTLTLDLIAKTGGFEQGFDKAQRVADKKLRQIERDAAARSKAIQDAFTNMAGAIAGPLAAAFSVGAVVDYARQLVQTGAEIQRFAQLAGASATEFQKFAHGAESAGVPIDKFADILKDVQEKIGEFLLTGGGELKDFFEVIAPKVGLTADAFRKLSGPEALQAYFSALEKSGIGQKEVIAQMEALASDSSLLIPLLRDNAQGFREAADEAERFGLVLSDEALAGLDEIRKGGKQAQDSFEGWAKQLAQDMLPTLLEMSRNLQGVGLALNGLGQIANVVVRGTFNTLATAAIGVSKAFEYMGTAVGGTLAAISQAGTGEFSQALETLKALGNDLTRIDNEAQGAIARVWTGGTEIKPLELPRSTEGAAMPAKPSKTPAKGSDSSRGRAEYEPLTDAARAYETALASLNRIQTEATTSGWNLNTAQQELLRVMQSPEWLQMPETWRVAVAEHGQYAINVEIAAKEQERLNELLAATPTAQLEAQRATMQFLASAFEQGRISAEQFSEAATAALGNVPANAEPAKDSFLDLTDVANDAARNMANVFADFFSDTDQNIGDMLTSFLEATAKMIMQAMMLQAVQAGMTAMGFPMKFAKGGVFDGGLQAFADGGVVNQPTFFKFADGGGFKNGLMGEAGPEAILPLKRGADGKLGVATNGSSGANVNIAIHEAPGTKATVNQRSDSQGNLTLDIIIDQIESKMSQNIARGRSPLGSVMERQYGLNRANGALR